MCSVASMKATAAAPTPSPPHPSSQQCLPFFCTGGLFEGAKAGSILFSHVSVSVWGGASIIVKKNSSKSVKGWLAMRDGAGRQTGRMGPSLDHGRAVLPCSGTAGLSYCAQGQQGCPTMLRDSCPAVLRDMTDPDYRPELTEKERDMDTHYNREKAHLPLW